MKKLYFIFIISFSAFLFASEALIFHEIRGDETLWFLAEVYYGQGDQYQKIIEANHVQTTTKLLKGQRLLIPNPKFRPGSDEFESRFQKIKKIREIELAKKSNSSPSERVKAIFEKKTPLKSPQQQANDELPTH